MGRPLLIIGTGGLAGEIGHLAKQIDPDRKVWPTISFVAESPSEIGQLRPFGRVDYCDAELDETSLAADVVIALGDPKLRKRVALSYSRKASFSFPNLIHSSVVVPEGYFTLGKGNVIDRGVMLACNVIAGDFNVFGKGSFIGHNVTIGSFNQISIASSLAGSARIANCCLIGIGARVMENVSLADDTIAGAGAVVLRDVSEPGHTMVGVPARLLR